MKKPARLSIAGVILVIVAAIVSLDLGGRQGASPQAPGPPPPAAEAPLVAPTADLRREVA